VSQKKKKNASQDTFPRPEKKGQIQRALKIDPVLNLAGKLANATNDQAPINRKNK
jgi:hypothetical protein